LKKKKLRTLKRKDKKKKKKKKRTLLSEQTFKNMMSDFMEKIHPPENPEMLKLEKKVKTAHLAQHPGIANKLARDKIKLEISRQQNLNTPSAATTPYTPGTGQNRFRRNDPEDEGSQPQKKKARNLGDGTRLNFEEEEEDENEDEDEDEDEGNLDLPADLGIHEEWKKSQIVRRIPVKDKKKGEDIFELVNSAVNKETGYLQDTHNRPGPVFNYLLNPSHKKPPNGIDNVLGKFKNKPKALPVSILSGNVDVSTPFLNKMDTLNSMNINFIVYQQHIKNMTDAQFTKFLKFVNKLPKKPSKIEKLKIDHALNIHLQKHPKHLSGVQSPRTVLKSSQTKDFITMIVSATQN